MLFRIFTALSLALPALSGVGPSSLYTLLNGQTFNPPGYTIVAYQSCMQNQNAGNPCGSFTSYLSSNGQYTYQKYGPAPCSGSCCREFHLTLACGATLQMSGVNENPICTYSATLSLPEVCGVDFTVGNEAASVSPSALPPTPTSTTTGTNTATSTSTGTTTQSPTQSVTQTSTQTMTASATITASGTATTTETLTASSTSTPLFVITAYPTSTATPTLTASSTPLFMITAWPTTSPVNVSATSTPLYYMTPYPSYDPTNGTGSGLLGAIISVAPSGTATILGSVAVGIAGLGAIGFAANYLRKGGSISGLIGIAKANQGQFQNLVKDLPMDPKMKAALNDPKSLLPPEQRAMAEKAEKVVQDPSQIVNQLPVSDALKAQLQTYVPTSTEQVINAIQHPEELKEKVISVVKDTAITVAKENSPINLSPEVLKALIPTLLAQKVAETSTIHQPATVQISQEQLAALLANQVPQIQTQIPSQTPSNI